MGNKAGTHFVVYLLTDSKQTWAQTAPLGRFRLVNNLHLVVVLVYLFVCVYFQEFLLI